VESGSHDRHRDVLVGDQPIGERVAQRQDAEATGRLGERELLIMQSERVGPMVEKDSMGLDLVRVPGQVLGQALERWVDPGDTGRRQVAHPGAQARDDAERELRERQRHHQAEPEGEQPGDRASQEPAGGHEYRWPVPIPPHCPVIVLQWAADKGD